MKSQLPQVPGRPPRGGLYQQDVDALAWARRHHLQPLAAEAPEQQAWGETCRYRAVKKYAAHLRGKPHAQTVLYKRALKTILTSETHAEYWISGRGIELSRIRKMFGRK